METSLDGIERAIEALSPQDRAIFAEKLEAMRTEDYFRERAARGNLAKAKCVLSRAGKAQPPIPGDEIN